MLGSINRAWCKPKALLIPPEPLIGISDPLQASFLLEQGLKISSTLLLCWGYKLIVICQCLCYIFPSCLSIFNYTFYGYYYNETHFLYCVRVTSSMVSQMDMSLRPSLLFFFFNSYVCSINIKIISHKAVKIWGMAAKKSWLVL